MSAPALLYTPSYQVLAACSFSLPPLCLFCEKFANDIYDMYAFENRELQSGSNYSLIMLVLVRFRVFPFCADACAESKFPPLQN